MGRILFTLIGAGIIVGATAFTSQELTVAVRTPSETLTELFANVREAIRGDESRAILILGKAGEGWTAGELTDTILLAVLDPPSGNTSTEDGPPAFGGRATIISIPRDLLVQMPTGTTSKINALWLIGKQDASARGRAGDTDEAASLIREAVENITGAPIKDVLVVDVSGTAQAIDALGGVAINVSENINDQAFPTPGGGIERFAIEPGFRVLDGSTAVKYARTRHTPEGDFGRIRRQQQILEALVAKARGLKFTEDPGKTLELYRTIAPRIETTIDATDVPRLAALVIDIPSANIRTFALETLGEEPLLKNGGGTTLIPRNGIFEYDEIRAAVAELLEK